jgi:UDP-sugar transporter A1/2/3
LTTAAFSVLLLRKKLFTTQWLALFLLAVGVGVVQIQSNNAAMIPSRVVDTHSMNQIKGFVAVIAACCTSGLAGVYFEMVLKGSPGDVWVRNVQLSLFSLLPALSPIMFAYAESNNGMKPWTFSSLFDNFGPWAWATVATQVVGGLVTAMVIKYADNILKGFATSLSIVISSLASVALFNFIITFTFLLGSLTVLVATWLYNQPQKSVGTDDICMGHNTRRRGMAFGFCGCDDTIPMSSLSHTSDDSELAWEQDEGSQSSLSFSNSRCSSV